MSLVISNFAARQAVPQEMSFQNGKAATSAFLNAFEDMHEQPNCVEQLRIVLTSLFVPNLDQGPVLEQDRQVREPDTNFTLRTSFGCLSLDCLGTESITDLLARAARLASELGIPAPAQVSVHLPIGAEPVDTGTLAAELPHGTELIISETDGCDTLLYVEDKHLGPSVLVAGPGTKSVDFENDLQRDMFSKVLVCNLSF